MLASHDQDILCSRACLSDGVEAPVVLQSVQQEAE